MMIRRSIRLAGAATLLGGAFGVGLAAGPAWGATVFSGHGVPFAFDFGSSGVPGGAFDLNVPSPSPLPSFDPSAAGCPFDSAAAFVGTGNVVLHESDNNNGSWGGGTGTGKAILQAKDGTPLYSGQMTAWLRGGTNVGPDDRTGQAEEGETFHFHGTAVDPANPWPKLDVSVDYHLTVNNHGSLTKMSEDISCR